VENSAEFLGKNDFSKLFPRKIQFFLNIFWGKIFRGIFPKIFPGKKCTKNWPQIGRIFAYWVTVYARWAVFENYRSGSIFWATLFLGKSNALILT
jgi:hypothetical protein